MKRYNFFLFALIATCSVFSYAQKIVVGTYTFKDGAVYTGDLFNGKPNGRGRTVFKNGDIYEGDYFKTKREGEGTMTYASGERYEGQWFQDQQHGRGT